MNGDNNNDNLEQFYGGDNNDNMFGGGSSIMSFDNFLQQREQQQTGGVKKAKAKADANETAPEVLEGYDSFTILQSSVGEKGHRFISKSPYGAALKTATCLFNILNKRKSKSDKVNFIIQKTTKGSNRKLYAYTATNEILATPYIIFKKDEDGNRIVMNHHGQVLRIDPKNNILNVSGDVKTKGKGKKQSHAVYDPKTTLTQKFSSSELTNFDYTPYVFREVANKVKITVDVVPEELKPLQKNVAKKEKDAVKKAEKKEKTAMKKEKEAAKKAEKKEKEAAKKAEKKEKEAAKKAAKKEKAAMKPKAAKKAKSPKAKKPKAEKAEKPPKAKSPKVKKPRTKKAENPLKKAKSPKVKKPRTKKAATGGYCGNSACGMNVY